MITIGELLESNARKFGGREALLYQDRRYSFVDVDVEATRAAAALQSLGVEKGDKVAVMGQNTTAFVFACFGALRIGAVIVPINHKLMPPETAYILEHSESKVWLFDGSLADVARKVSTKARVLCMDSDADGFERFEAVMAAGHPYRPQAVNSDDLGEILYTSGTTGKPKGCMHSQANVLLAAIASNLVFGLGQFDRTLIGMPIWHCFPLNNMLIGSYYVGASVVLMREYHPVEFLKLIQAERCTAFFGAPIAFIMPVQKVPVFDSFDLSSVRIWMYGGGPIDADTARMLMDRYKTTNFYQVFGMTETGPTGMALYPSEQVAKAGSIGRYAISGCDMRVVKADGGEAGPGEIGEIWFRCQSIMRGYYRDPVATAEVFSDGWYKTGDLARLDEDGYLFIVDRAKDMIIVGGENVYCKEVEDVLAAYPGVLECAVVGQKDKDWGETVVAVVVAQEPLDEASLKAHLGERLARYKVPRVFRFVDQLPRTPTGKVMKYVIRDTLAG